VSHNIGAMAQAVSAWISPTVTCSDCGDRHRATNKRSKCKVKYNADIFTLWDPMSLQ